MSRDEESSRRSREDMRMTAMKTVPRTVVQNGSRSIGDDGKAKRKIAPNGPFTAGGDLFISRERLLRQ